MRCDRLLDEVARRPVAGAAADALDEVVQDLAALGRVHDFGVKLDAVEAARFVGDGGQRRVGAWAMARKPSGSCSTRSPWLIQTCSEGGQFGEERIVRARVAGR